MARPAPSKLLALLVVTVLGMVVSIALATLSTHALRKKGRFFATGDVLVSRKVRSNVECATECAPPGCVGYHILDNGTGLECTAFSAVDNYTEDLGYRYYCSECRYKDEPCTADQQCSELTLYGVCDPVTSTCACNQFTIDDGPLCKPKASELGEACGMDAQCLATTNNSRCDTTLPAPVCVCDTQYVPVPTGDACKFDHAAYGFVPYNGRLIYHRQGLIPISWDGALQFCKDIHSTMFIPRDASEWNWMSGEIHFLSFGLHFPINDKGQEGTVVWNDGTSVAGVSFLQWALGSAGLTNTILSNCVWMIPAVPFVSPAVITFKTCFLPELNCVICEAL